MSKAKAAERGVTRTEPPLQRQASDEEPLPPLPASTSYAQTRRPRARSGGGFYDPAFLRAVAPLYDLHMGAENVAAPLLAGAIFETREGAQGASYTSVFILQALRDNAAELEAYRELRAAGMCRCGPAPWSVDAFFDRSAGDGGGRYRGEDVVRHGSARDACDSAWTTRRRSGTAETSTDRRDTSNGVRTETKPPPTGRSPPPSAASPVRRGASPRTPTGPSSSLASPPPLLARFSEHVPRPGSAARVAGGTLHCVDNMAHEATTADKVREVADRLGMSDRLRLHAADRVRRGPARDARAGGGVRHALDRPRRGEPDRAVPGELVAEDPVRGRVRARALDADQRAQVGVQRMSTREPTPPRRRRLDTMSLLEPHKMFQNAVTMFQKLG